VPDRLRPLLETPADHLTGSALSVLQSSDQPLLLQLYRNTPALAGRRVLTWALAWIGNDEVVDVFKESLFKTYAGRTLRNAPRAEEEFVLHVTIIGLGFLAPEQDSAFEVVRDGIDPRYWKERVPWQSDAGTDSYAQLAINSLQALGLSGRPEVGPLLEKLKTANLSNPTEPIRTHPGDLAGGVADAAFAYNISSTRGLAFSKANYFGDQAEQLLKEWYQSESGRAWTAWYRQRRGLPPLEN
jgi:hypothetical protein